MGKKNTDGVNFQTQQDNLNAVDRAIMGDLSAMNIREDIEDTYTDITDAEFMDGVFGMLQEKQKYRAEHSHEYEVEDIDPMNIILPADDEDEEDEEEDNDTSIDEPIIQFVGTDTEDESSKVPQFEMREPEQVEAPTTYNMITIDHKVGANGAYDIVDINDGLRTLSIDIATLEPDETTIAELYEGEDTDAIVGISISSLLANFFPGMMISKERFDSYMRHVVEFEGADFRFYEYDDGNNNFVVGYRMEDEFSQKFFELCNELEERGLIISFLRTLIEMTSMDGFCFRNMTGGRLKQVMLTEYMNKMSKAFIDDFIDDDELVVKDKETFNESANDVIQVLPYNFMNAHLTRLLEDDSDDTDESDEEDEEDEEPEEETEEVVEEEESSNPVEEVTETSVEVHKEVHQEAPVVEEESSEEEDSAEDLFDGVETSEEPEPQKVEEPEEVKELGGYSMDPDEAEADYYASKGQKPPKNVAPKKPKPSDDDASQWIIKRR